MCLNVRNCIVLALILMCSTAYATTFTFNSDPFAGTPVLGAPGRQIVGGEDFISFSTATDVFALNSDVFHTGNTVDFVNTTAPFIPMDGVNVIVLETFDNDNNTATPFGAGQAADLIADRVTATGPGFFIYFNQALDLPRLVFSTDLSSHDADLKIVARMLNLNGAAGRNTLPNFTAANFEFTSASGVPEPSSLSMAFGSFLMGAGVWVLRRMRARA
jgi:hypothetical protein